MRLLVQGLGFALTSCDYNSNPYRPETDIEEEAQKSTEGAFEANRLGKGARLGLDADVSSSINEFAPAVLASIPCKCERCGAAAGCLYIYIHIYLYIYTRTYNHVDVQVECSLTLECLE